MSQTDVLQLATQYLRRLEANDFEGAMALTAPGATFWLANTGDMNRKQMRAFIEPVSKLVESIHFELTGSTVQGERVAIEVRGEMPLTNGRVYRNRYHFLFIVRDGQIAEVREYADSAPAQAAFFA